MTLRAVWAVLLGLIATTARADLEVPRDGFEFDPELTGRGERMNYGPFLAYSLHNAHLEAVKPGKGKAKPPPPKVLPGLRTEKQPPLVLRAINIWLGGKHACAFDTERCGFAAAWSGGFLNISQTNLNGYKGNDLAYLRLPAVFQNGLIPGWSHDGDFKDSRPTPFGALPKHIAHYKGLYLHGNRTVLSYTVGRSRVLELPAMLVRDGHEAFCRTIRVDSAPRPRWLFVCDLPGAAGTVPAGDLASLTRRGVTLRVASKGAPPGSKLVVQGDRIVLALPAHREPITFRVFVTARMSAAQLRDLVRDAGPTEDPTRLCKGGPRRWKKEIALPGKRGEDKGAYTVDTVPLPEDNPWGSWMRPGGLDFFSDGRAVLCTWSGDVWIVSGLDAKLEKVRWRRFATGIFEALGLKVVDDVVYVLGRDQITRLHDLNGDGEADFYENFYNDGPTAPSFHSFAIELHTDRAGNFYYTRGGHRVQEGTPMHGGVIRVAKDGSRAELICHGFREVNGMSIGPDDTITAADNQGNWVPTSKIDFVKRGAFYGYRWGLARYPEPEKPLCWIPYAEDNSSGGQVWVRGKRWGPFEGHLLHTSYGTCKLFKVHIQRDGERFQGGVTPFPFVFPSGIHRAAFSPADGQLYLCGLKGWGTSAKEDGCFNRVRYTGRPVTLPAELRIDRGRIRIRYPVALAASSVRLAGVAVQQWNYRWTKDYGSKDYSVANPARVGRDPVAVRAVRLSADGRTITLEVPGLAPVMQMSIRIKGLRTRDGLEFETLVYNTINHVP